VWWRSLALMLVFLFLGFVALLLDRVGLDFRQQNRLFTGSEKTSVRLSFTSMG
jgi:hypothetical protein